MGFKSKVRQVHNWYELLELVEQVNYYKETLVLTGYTNLLDNNRLYIGSLFFSTKPVEILKENEDELIVRYRKKPNDKKDKTTEKDEVELDVIKDGV